jgi:hypothetical protein
MTYREIPITVIKEQIAYSLAEDVFRLFDHTIAVLDRERNKALIIEQSQVVKKRN